MPRPQRHYDRKSSDTENWTSSPNQPEGIAGNRRPRLLEGIKETPTLVSPERQEAVPGRGSMKLINIQEDALGRTEPKVKADAFKGAEKAPTIKVKLASRHLASCQNLPLKVQKKKTNAQARKQLDIDPQKMGPILKRPERHPVGRPSRL
ncbi:hypothetical protein PIB30_062265 [Stylosanthes scabra]|uniref:Uncharacterized protein n=1 Tax=Stylosanthes scabra TaxID=79078 RepID=A0ABU6QLN6_9FABA|nr:hypothetical protein [Stylosanthes scabra]